jgi:trans-aconitate methyltransferase
VLYPLVADHLRTYLQARSGLIITDLTTQEIMSLLKAQTTLTDASRRLLEQIFEQADLVKFARFAPDDTQGTRYINAAIRWLREAEAGWDL